MMDDKIVEETRKVREAHAAQFGYDLEAINDLKEKEQRGKRKVVSFPPKRPVVISTKGD